MSSTIRELAGRAGAIFRADLPAPVVERARLQHLNLAGAVSAVRQEEWLAALVPGRSARGSAAIALGGRAPRREAVRLHCAMGGLLELDDAQLGGRIGAVAVPVAWAHGKGRRLDDLVRATVAANEVCGRLGLALALSPLAGRGQLLVSAWASVLVAGLLSDLDEDRLAHALALASVGVGQLGPRELLGGEGAAAIAQAAAAVAGLDAVELARGGATGALDLLDARDGLLERLSPVPLRHAFSGWGRAWLTTTCTFPEHPIALPLQGALQGVEEILARHVKAAEKRLRADQVERVEIAVGAAAFQLDGLMGRWPAAGRYGLTARVSRAIGTLVVDGEYGPAGLLARARPEAQQLAIAEVAGRVHLRHDWARTGKMVSHLVDVLAPVLAGLSADEIRRAASSRQVVGFPALPVADDATGILQMARLRPGALADRLRYQSGDLGDAALDELQLLLGADVRVLTTRGGGWPEHREVPIGSPGWSWADTVQRVERRAPREALSVWRAASTDLDAEEAIDRLMGGSA